jgi:hypothetical protein
MWVLSDLDIFSTHHQLMRKVKNRTLTDRTRTVPRKVQDRAASDVRIWIQVHRKLTEVGQTPV